MNKPFLACLELSTPLIVDSAIKPTLDAILGGELGFHMSDEDALAEIPLKKTKGIPHGSQMYLDAVNWRHHFHKVCLRPRAHWEAPVDALQDNVRGGIKVKRGEGETSLNKYEAQVVRAVYFAGIGAPQEVEAILQDVRAIGTRRADGMGMIREASVEELPEAPELWGIKDAAGMPMRQVPQELWKEFGGCDTAPVMAVRPRPFYWDPKQAPEACFMPPHHDAAALLDQIGEFC